ncbi:MAG: hypothetical protein LBQ12_02675, partial [Deltaproteobacteria bacterium]|nr:hypothetical protein [Deltaproteobacteria bacterium]
TGHTQSPSGPTILLLKIFCSIIRYNYVYLYQRVFLQLHTRRQYQPGDGDIHDVPDEELFLVPGFFRQAVQ